MTSTSPPVTPLVLSDSFIFGRKRLVFEMGLVKRPQLTVLRDELRQGWWCRIDRTSNKFYYFSRFEFINLPKQGDLYGEGGFKWTWSYRPRTDTILVSEQRTIVKSVVDFFKRLWYSIAY